MRVIVREKQQAICVTSIDRISAFDTISWRAVLLGLERLGNGVTICCAIIPLRTVSLHFGDLQLDRAQGGTKVVDTPCSTILPHFSPT